MNIKYHKVSLTYEPSARYWQMDVGKGNINPPNYPGLVIPFNHKGEITFRITDTPGVIFANPAFVQKKGAPNPGDFNAQFSQEIKANGKVLVVTDANANANGQPYTQQDYHYELRFSNDVPLDPVITNMGCCKRADPTAYYAIGAGIALLALYLFFIRPLMSKRSGGNATGPRKGGNGTTSGGTGGGSGPL